MLLFSAGLNIYEPAIKSRIEKQKNQMKADTLNTQAQNHTMVLKAVGRSLVCC